MNDYQQIINQIHLIIFIISQNTSFYFLLYLYFYVLIHIFPSFIEYQDSFSSYLNIIKIKEFYFNYIIKKSVVKQEMKQNQWYLKEEFIISQLERINNPDYFAINFSCPDLDLFIQGIKTTEQAVSNREALNRFFDEIISSADLEKSIYVRLKWIAYLNKLIQNTQQGSVLFPLNLKALQVYIEKISPIQDALNCFDKYLLKKLVKPYLQYLSKLCMLYMPLRREKKIEQKQLESNKQNINHFNIKTNQKQEIIKKTLTCQEQERNEQGIIKWYREYNFLLQTLETFEPVLAQFTPFFKSELPYLCNIRKYISKDLKNILKRLKETCLSLRQLNVTLIEQEELQTKISKFSQADSNIFEGTESVLFTNIQDYTRQDIQNFMCTPMKPGMIPNVTTASLLF